MMGIAGLFLAASLASVEPYLKWVFIVNDITTDACLESFENAVERSGKCGYNGVLWDAGRWTNGVDFRWDAARLARLEKARTACRKAGLEIIPMVWSVGRAMAIVDRDPTLAETDMVGKVPYAVRGGRAVFAPKGETVAFATNGVIRVDTAGPDSVSIVVKVKPHTKYRITAIADTDGVRRHPVTEASHSTVYGTFSVVVRKSRGGKRYAHSRESFHQWEQGCVRNIDLCFDFITQENEEALVTFAMWRGAKTGWATFRDFRVTEVGVVNPVVREGAPFAVRRASDGREYVPGRDYVLPATSSKWIVTGSCAPVEIALPKGSAIAEGEELEIDYSSALVRSRTQIGVCMANPALYRFFDETAPEIDRLFGHPKRWFLSMDEIRTGGTCGLCRSDRPENLAKWLADCLRHQRDAIRRVRPDAQIFAWNDMYDPYCNAAVDKDGFVMTRGDFSFTEFRVPKDIVAVPWGTPPAARKGFDYLTKLGIPFLHGTYYDVDSLEHPRCRASIEVDREYRRKGSCIGTMYTTWDTGGKLTLLEGFADLMKDIR